jgi:hypothetical protein
MNPGTYTIAEPVKALTPEAYADWKNDHKSADGCFATKTGGACIIISTRNGKHRAIGSDGIVFNECRTDIEFPEGRIAISSDLGDKVPPDQYKFTTKKQFRCEKSDGFVFLRIGQNTHWMRIGHVSHDE